MTIKILGIDASLRSTGYGIVNYERASGEIWADYCGVISTPVKFKGTDAILFMINALQELKSVLEGRHHHIVIESPAATYFSGMSSSGLIPVAHVAGAAAVIFGTREGKFTSDHLTLVRPSEWNKCRQKEKTAARIIDIFGELDHWGYVKKPSTESKFEHLIDAIAMAYWKIENEYIKKEIN